MSAESKQRSADLTAGEVADIPENALRILQAATRLFALKGYVATSVREIVQEAEVTNPMLYYYFDSKEGLFTALTELMHREFQRELEEAIQIDAPLEDVLTEVVVVHLKGVRETPDVLRFVYSLLFGAEQSCPENRLYESHRQIVDALEDLLETAEEGGEFRAWKNFDHRWLAVQLLGLINSHSMRLTKEIEKMPEADINEFLRQQAGPEAARRLVQFFLSGAGEVVT